MNLKKKLIKKIKEKRNALRVDEFISCLLYEKKFLLHITKSNWLSW